MLHNEFTCTKRQLGILLLVIGLVAFILLLTLDVVLSGREGGVGPAQRLALIISAFTALLGLGLIPLGDRPA